MSNIIQQQCEIFSQNYPELMDRTILVNTPVMFSLIYPQIKKHFKKSGTGAKFTTVSAPDKLGELLASECAVPIGSVPEEYGGHQPKVFDYEPLSFAPQSAPRSSDPLPRKKKGILKNWKSNVAAGSTQDHDDGHVHDSPVGENGKKKRFGTVRSMLSVKSKGTKADDSPADESRITPSGEATEVASQPTMTPASAGNNETTLPEIAINADNSCAVESTPTEARRQSLIDGAHAAASSGEITVMAAPQAASGEQQVAGPPGKEIPSQVSNGHKTLNGLA